MHNNFNKDLPDGEKVEKDVAGYLFDNYKAHDFDFNKDYRYDISCLTKDKKRITIEVKGDFEASRTGNVVIEFMSRGKLSGISRSLAQYWIIKTGDSHFMISTKKLRDIIKRKLYKRIVNGGDNKTSKLYLFPISEFKKHSKLI